MIKAVFFDIDNTLYSYTKGHAAGLDAVRRYAEENLGIPGEEMEEIYKQQIRILKAQMGPLAASHNRRIRFLRIVEERKLPLEYADILDEVYWTTLISTCEPEPGLVKCLEELKAAGYILGIGSNMTLDWQFKKLRALKLTPYFEYIVTSEEVGVEKPDWRLFHACARKAGVLPPEVVFVGDNLSHDVMGAECANLEAVWYDPNRTDFQGHRGISHYDQLKALIDSL